MPNTRRLFLFDIDGTLINSDGAGGAALLSAFGEVFDVVRPSPVPLHGRTDLGIMKELMDAHRVPFSQTNLKRLCTAYFQRLPMELAKRSGETLPGVVDLLAMLGNDKDCQVALLTGNMPYSAQLKLEHFELWEHFQFGIFGDLAEARPRLAEPAHALIRKHFSETASSESIVIIGDTPLDIELARTMRVRSLGVCTGGFEKSELEGAGADWVAEDLADTQSVLAWLMDSVESMGGGR